MIGSARPLAPIDAKAAPQQPSGKRSIVCTSCHCAHSRSPSTLTQSLTKIPLTTPDSGSAARMSSSFLLPGLRRLALKAPLAPMACCQCLRQQTQRPSIRPSRILRIVRQASTQAQPATAGSNSIKTNAAAAKAAWPETNSKAVGYWLLGSATSVFGIVVFGGLTRLTESGYVPSTHPQLQPSTRQLTLGAA